MRQSVPLRMYAQSPCSARIHTAILFQPRQVRPVTPPVTLPGLPRHTAILSHSNVWPMILSSASGGAKRTPAAAASINPVGGYTNTVQRFSPCILTGWRLRITPMDMSTMSLCRLAQPASRTLVQLLFSRYTRATSTTPHQTLILPIRHSSRASIC